MSDDLVKRLRYWAGFGYGVEASATMNAASDRIEQLEAALREFSCECSSNCEWERDEICHTWIARAALGEKKDER